MNHPSIPKIKGLQITRYAQHFTITRGEEYQPFKDSRALDRLMFAKICSELWRERAAKWESLWAKEYERDREDEDRAGLFLMQSTQCSLNANAWRAWGEQC
jgi:hypothetical protein